MIEQMFIRVSRPPRRLYRYLTGDPTCLGFVRTMCALVAILQVLAVIADVRDGHALDAGLGLVGPVFLIVVLGPALFRVAASTDRSPIGPGVEARHPFTQTFGTVTTGILIAGLLVMLCSLAAGVPPSAGDLLANLGSPPFIFAIWAAQDRDGGKGDRTLTKDVRRLLTRPALAPAVREP